VCTVEAPVATCTSDSPARFKREAVTSVSQAGNCVDPKTVEIRVLDKKVEPRDRLAARALLVFELCRLLFYVNSKQKAHDDYAGHDPHDAQRISDGVGKSRNVGQRFVGLQSSLLGGSQGRRVCGRPGEKTRRRSKSDSKKHGEDQRQESPANDDRAATI
jgi:hypothetical protein